MNENTIAMEITAPVTGTMSPLSDVADPAFARGLLGPGVAIVPTEGRVLAPVAGEIVVAMPHAYGIRTAHGVEVLIHIGLDTVQLDGREFFQYVARSMSVQAGEPLCTVDLDGVTAAGFDPTIVVVVTKSPDGTAVRVVAGDTVSHGDPLLAVSIP